MKEEPLLEVWANLVADWNAWEDEEGEAVLIRRGSFCFAGASRSCSFVLEAV
jgi:hypothetical protein